MAKGGNDVTVLGPRTLNRTLLERQRLLERVDAPLPAIVEHLAGMQAQNPLDPYVSLHARVVDFDPMRLSDLIAKRKLVRTSLMRSTIHLVAARDALAFRPLLQIRLERSFYGQAWGAMLGDVDVDEVVAFGYEVIAEGPRTTSALREELARRYPSVDTGAIVALVKHVVPSVQVPPRGLWRRTALPAWAAMDAWLGKPLAQPRPERFLLRYLTAFGPATLADFRNWSGLTGFNDVVEEMRPNLRTFRDEDGRELLDVETAPIADPDVGAPTRFFADYDNVFLGHLDRSRAYHADRNPIGRKTFTVDGYPAGSWTVRRKKSAATIVLEPWLPLRKADRAAVAAEAETLLAFLHPDVERDLRFV